MKNMNQNMSYHSSSTHREANTWKFDCMSRNCRFKYVYNIWWKKVFYIEQMEQKINSFGRCIWNEKQSKHFLKHKRFRAVQKHHTSKWCPWQVLLYLCVCVLFFGQSTNLNTRAEYYSTDLLYIWWINCVFFVNHHIRWCIWKVDRLKSVIYVAKKLFTSFRSASIYNYMQIASAHFSIAVSSSYFSSFVTVRISCISGFIYIYIYISTPHQLNSDTFVYWIQLRPTLSFICDFN